MLAESPSAFPQCPCGSATRVTSATGQLWQNKLCLLSLPHLLARLGPHRLWEVCDAKAARGGELHLPESRGEFDT